MKPRTVLIDTDCDTLMTFERNFPKLKSSIDQDWIVSGKENGANFFNRGYCSTGKKILDSCLERIRKQLEMCSFP